MNPSDIFLIQFTNSCDNSNDSSSSAAENVYNCITLILTPISIVLNSFSFVIFSGMIWKHCVMSKILKTLSLFETLFNISVMIGISLGLKIYQNQPSLIAFLLLIYTWITANILMIVFLIARNWSVVLLAAYRYEAICKPAGSRKYIRSENINIIFICVFGIAVFIAFPRIFETQVLVCSTNWKVQEIIPYFIASKWYVYLHNGVLLFLVQNGGPVIAIILLSSFVLKEIRKMKECRKKLISSNRSKAHPTGDKLILILSIAFFILEVPAFFSKMMHHYLAYKQYHEVDFHFALIANMLIYLDSIINVAVYVVSNPTFRLSSKKLLSKCFLRKFFSNPDSQPETLLNNFESTNPGKLNSI